MGIFAKYSRVEWHWCSIFITVLLLQYCSITISWWSEKVPLKYHFVTLYLFRNKVIDFNLVTVSGNAKINIILLYSLIVYLHMRTCKSYFSKKEIKSVGIFVLFIHHGIKIFNNQTVSEAGIAIQLHNRYNAQH